MDQSMMLDDNPAPPPHAQQWRREASRSEKMMPIYSLLNREFEQWSESRPRVSLERNKWKSKDWQQHSVELIKKALREGGFRDWAGNVIELPHDWVAAVKNAVDVSFTQQKIAERLANIDKLDRPEDVKQKYRDDKMMNIFWSSGFLQELISGTPPNSPVIQQGFVEDVNPEEMDENIVSMHGSGYKMHHLQPYLTYLKKQYSNIDSSILQELEDVISQDLQGAGFATEASESSKFPDTVYGIDDPPFEIRGLRGAGNFLARGADTCVFSPYVPNKNSQFVPPPGVDLVSRILDPSRAKEVDAQYALQAIIDDGGIKHSDLINLALDIGVPEDNKITDAEFAKCKSGDKTGFFSDVTNVVNLITRKQSGSNLGPAIKGASAHEAARIRHDLLLIMFLMADVNAKYFVHGDLHSSNMQFLKSINSSLVVFDFGRSFWSLANATKVMKNLKLDPSYRTYMQHKFPYLLVNDMLPGIPGFLKDTKVTAKQLLNLMILSYDTLSILGLLAKEGSSIGLTAKDLSTFIEAFALAIQFFAATNDEAEFTKSLKKASADIFKNLDMTPPSDISQSVQKLSSKRRIKVTAKRQQGPKIPSQEAATVVIT